MHSLFKQSMCDAQNERIHSLLSGKSNQEKRLRMNVYRNNMHCSLLESLASIFPKCAQMMGDDIFRTVALGFIQESLPHSPILHEYGEGFPEFLDQLELPAELVCTPLLAKLEYQLLQLTHAAEDTVLSSEQLYQQLNTTSQMMDQTWTFSSTLTLWQSPIALGSIYHSLNQDMGTELSEQDWRNTEYLVLHKQRWFGVCSVVTEDVFTLLCKLKQGQSLAQASQDMAPDTLPQTLNQLLSLPIICQLGDASC